MTSFEKFRLVPNEQFNRLRQHDLRSYDPKLRALVTLDQEMTAVLNRTDISPEEKMTIYQQAQHRFMSLFKTIATTLQSEVPAAAPGQLDQDDDEEVLAAPSAAAAPARVPAAAAAAVADEFVTAPTAGPSVHSFVKQLKLPSNREPKAFSLMEFIQKHPSLVNFDSHDRLVLNHKPIEGTKFSDLFRELYIHSHSHNIHGLEPFMHALRSLNISPNAISNSNLLDYLKSAAPSSQSGKGHRHNPPGKVSKILRLYRL